MPDKFSDKNDLLLKLADIVSLETSRVNADHARQTIDMIKHLKGKDPDVDAKLVGLDRILSVVATDEFQSELKNLIVEVFDGLSRDDVARYLATLEHEMSVGKVHEQLFLRTHGLFDRIATGGNTHQVIH